MTLGTGGTQVAQLVAILRADVAQFEASISAAEAKLSGLSRTAATAGAHTSSSIASSFTKAGNTLSSVGAKMATTGRHLTTSVTLPIAAIGTVATKSALDFNTAFAKIDALAGKIGVSMTDAKKQVESLAAATGQAPQDLADSLYFIASAGLKASKVMPTLKVTAEAAASGMGSAAEIGQTLTSVLNAYAGTGLDAAKSMNILTEAVKVGKAETSDFATGLGPVIGVAANAGVSLSQLTGAIAQATNLGIPFARAVTGLRYTIQSLESPTATATNDLKGFGVNAGDLAKMVADPNIGLVGTLQYLYKTLNDGSVAGRQAWSAISGGARSSIVAVDLVGQHTDQTNKIIQETGAAASDSATTFQDAYARMQQTPQFKLQQALAQLKNTAIDLGNTLIPILIHDVIPAIQSVVNWFAHLSDGTKSLMVRFALAAAVGGPLLTFVGSILKIGGAVTKAIGWLGNLAKAIVTTDAVAAGANVVPSVAGAGSLASAGYKIVPGFTGGQAIAGAAEAGGGASLSGVAGSLGTVAGWGALVAGGALAVTKSIDNMTTSTGDLASEFHVTTQRVQDLRDQINNGASWIGLGSATDKAKEALTRYNTVLQEAKDKGIPAVVVQTKLNEAWGNAVSQIGGVTGSLDQFQRVLEESLGIAKTTDEVKQLASAISGLKAATPAGANASFNAIAAQSARASRTGVDTTSTAAQATAFNKLVQVMRVARAQGVNLGQALGPEMAKSLQTGTLSIQQWRNAFAEAGAKIPFAASAQQGFQQQLLTTTKLTDQQKGSFNTLFGSFNTLGVHLSQGIAQFAHAGIAAGDYNGVLRVISDSIKGQVLSSFDNMRKSLDAQTQSQIQAALKAHDYIKAAELEATAQEKLTKQNAALHQIATNVEVQFAQYGKVLDSHTQKIIADDIATGKFKQAQDLLTKSLGDGTKATQLSADKVLGNVDATKKQTDVLKALTAEFPKNTDNLKANIQQLIAQAKNASDAQSKIDLLRQALRDMEGQYNFSIGADTSDANRQVLTLLDSMQKKGFTLDPHVVSGHYTGPRHAGGMVGEGSMPMPKAMMNRPDERLVVALRDEMVMSPAATRRYRADLEAMNAGTRHTGGMVDPAAFVADVTPLVGAVRSGLQQSPNLTAKVYLTADFLRGLTQEFTSGYLNPLRDIKGLTRSRIDEGVDFGGSGPIYAVGPGRVLLASGSTGWPGGGWVSYMLTAGSKKGMAVYDAEDLSPAVRAGQQVTAQTKIAELHGGMEMGWAVPSAIDEALAYTHYHEGDVTAEGRSFARFYDNLPSKADNGAYFTKRTDVSMMPGEIALAPDSTRSVAALSKAIGQAARLHNGGFPIPVPPGQQGGGGGGGGGGGNGGNGLGLFGKVFSDFDKTLGMSTTQALADAFVAKLKAEFRSTKALNLGEITKVVDAMFQQTAAANYLNALTNRWESAVPGKKVLLSDKQGRSYGITQAILKMLGAHTGTGGGGGTGGGTGGGDGSTLAFHLGPLAKLLKILKVAHQQSVLDNVKQRYEPHHQFPFDWLGNILRGAGLKDIHQVDPKAKSLMDFMHDLASGIDHSPHGGHAGGGGGGGGGGSRTDQLIRDHKHWDRASPQQAHELARWMLDRNVNGLKTANAFHDLSYIIARESNWRWNAGDPAHAYGVPQALPGNKMASAGHDWLSNVQTQEDWMFKYIKGRYHTMAAALQHKKATNWYGTGVDRTFFTPTVIGVGERGPEHVKVTPLAQGNGDMKIQLRVDRKRFNRDLDAGYIVSGR